MGLHRRVQLPWTNFPDFAPKAGEVIGIDCELCSSDGGQRVDRTFVYSGPASVGSPASFGRVQLVDKIDPAKLEAYGRVLLPLSVTESANYGHLKATACLSPNIEKAVANIVGELHDAGGKALKKIPGARRKLEGSGFDLWDGHWELSDLPPGTYTVVVTASDKDGGVIVRRKAKIVYGDDGQK